VVERILVVDDESGMREFLKIMLEKMGYQVDSSDSGEDAIKKIEQGRHDLVICDLKMPRISGLEVLRRSKETNPEAPVLMITAFGSAESAVEAMKLGAYDYITKPFKVDEMQFVIHKAMEKARLLEENIQLKKELKGKYGFQQLIGVSEPMRKVYELIRQVSATKSNVLISGESGTGKELVAKAIHYNSPRRNYAFVVVNCASIPENLLESEMFGHTRGAFTGAYQAKRGMFEIADQGTIFLDEIADMPLSLQAKLLRVIEDKSFRRVGGEQEIKVDARIIAASNRDLEKQVKLDRFREDLYYRLNVIRIWLPPLRERKEDIPILAQHFLEKYVQEINKPIKKISEAVDHALLSYNWPGNVRELENVIERAVSMEKTEVILPESLPEKISSPQAGLGTISGIDMPGEGIDLEKTIEEIERKIIKEALVRSRGVKVKAAEMLGLSFRSFRYRVSKLGIDLGDDDGEAPAEEEVEK
jgi:two-component system, NtrC family, response regulator PilR